MDIGDYYDRKQQEHKVAWEKWQEAIKKYQADPTSENRLEMTRAEEKMIDAGNTGD